jgi:phosphate acetyltransferase
MNNNSHTHGAKIKALFDSMPIDSKITIGVICPDSKTSLEGPLLAAKEGTITPILIGPLEKIKKVAAELSEDISKYECIDLPEHEAIKYAIKLARENKVDVLMKGNIHTDTLMAEVVSKESGLRGDRRLSHCMLVDVPAYHKLLIFSDVALNIFPDLKTKKDIIQNAIDFACSLGIDKPKVALLSTTEEVTEKIPSTVDYKKLSEMANQGQITNGIVYGPLAFDAAISKEAAAIKKIDSIVAGDPDILIVPNLEAGNITIKAIELFGNSIDFGILLGAKVPLIIVSRSASIESRVGSCRLANFYVKHANTKS